MASTTGILFAEIEQLLSIHSKLSTQNKESLKIVLDQKMKLLIQCCADPQTSNYDLLEQLIKTKDQLATNNLDVALVESAITRMVKQLSARAKPSNDIDLAEDVPTQAPAATSLGKFSVARLQQGRKHHLSPAEAHKYDLIYNRIAQKYELVDAQGNSKANGFSISNIVRTYRRRNEVVLKSAVVHESIHITFRTLRDCQNFVRDFLNKRLMRAEKVTQDKLQDLLARHFSS